VDKTARLWHVANRTLRTALAQTDHLRAIAFSPAADVLATAGFDSRTHLRDPRTGQERQVTPENERGGWAGIYALAFAPDGKSFAAGLSDRQVRLRDAGGKALQTLSGHTDAVRSVAFSPDGQRLASASHHEVLIWDAVSGKRLQTLPGAAPVAFSPDGRRLVSGGAAPTVWEVASGAEWARLQGQRGEVYSFAFSPDGKWLALGSWLGITLLDWPAALAAQ
jgi:WD40 repeat protein